MTYLYNKALKYTLQLPLIYKQKLNCLVANQMIHLNSVFQMKHAKKGICRVNAQTLIFVEMISQFKYEK